MDQQIGEFDDHYAARVDRRFQAMFGNDWFFAEDLREMPPSLSFVPARKFNGDLIEGCFELESK